MEEPANENEILIGKIRELTQEYKQKILLPYIQDMTISHGRAAELLGISKETLIDLYGDMGIPYIDGSVQSVNEEIAVYSAAKAKE